MLLSVCIAKFHRATVTDANLNYIGSITIDEVLLESVGLSEGQMVQITSISNATLWRTYIIKGERGKGQIIINGPPARLFQKGDQVIIIAEALVTQAEAKTIKGPTVVFFIETGVNPNEIREVKKIGCSR